MTFVLTDLHESIATITFNHSEKRNCLSNALLGEIMAAMQIFREEKARVIIIRAQSGVRVWSSGLDINELPASGRDPLSYYDPLEQTLRLIQHSPAPVIALIEGGVWGGACELSVTCDIAIGCPSVSFAITPARMGVPYNSTGILHFINVVGMRAAKEMFFTAQPVLAQRALELGLLNHLVPAGELESFTYKMAGQIAENSPLGISVMKEQLRILGNSHPLTPETFERIQGLRRQVYDSYDYQEGKAAFFEKRKPMFRGE